MVEEVYCGKKVWATEPSQTKKRCTVEFGAHAPIILKYNEINEVQQFFNLQSGPGMKNK